jgi:hypothetical protein
MGQLEKVKLSQFGGVNTIMDSGNAGVSKSRVCRNILLRPLGAMAVPPRWASFSPAGTLLDLGFITNIDFLFDTSIRLLLQDEASAWWDASPHPVTGAPENVIVSYSGSTISADLTVTSSQYLAFKQSDGTVIQLGADAAANGWFTERRGTVPFYSTLYSADRAFVNGVGPVFQDGAGNSWRLQASSAFGIVANLTA